MAFPASRVSVAVAIAALLCACNNPAPAPAGESADAAAAPAAAVVPPSMIALQDHAPVVTVLGGNCALDVVNGAGAASTSVAAGSEVGMSGWIADATNAVPGDARLLLSGATRSYAGALTADRERPDVAAALGSDAARLAGFDVMASLAGVEPGDYTLSIIHGTEPVLACILNKTLVVTGG